MFTARIFIINFFVYSTILLSYVDFVFGSPCSRVPQGTGAGRSGVTGTIGLKISNDIQYYKPGRQYTGNKSLLSLCLCSCKNA